MSLALPHLNHCKEFAHQDIGYKLRHDHQTITHYQMKEIYVSAHINADHMKCIVRFTYTSNLMVIAVDCTVIDLMYSHRRDHHRSIKFPNEHSFHFSFCIFSARQHMITRPTYMASRQCKSDLSFYE